MKKLAMLPLAALALFLTGCGDAPYEEDAADRASGELKGGPLVADLQPDTKSENPESEKQDD